MAALAFVISCLALLVWSNRFYPNMPITGFLRHNPMLVSDFMAYALLALFLVSGFISLFLLVKDYIDTHRDNHSPHSRGRMITAALLCVCAIPAMGVLLHTSGTNAGGSIQTAGWQSSDQPNIIIVGIDSLRPDETGYFGNEGDLTPNIDQFLAQSTVYEHAYTPFARTFPAWMSILTGQEPVHHKGRFNLINHKHLDKSQTLPWWLKNAGYRTIFAFDERRFNSIDESFGYDEVVGPKIGALGFVMAKYDHPILNLICNTKVGSWLFPQNYLNRGRSFNYDPEQYNQAIIGELVADTSKPVFLSAHFLLPHYPWVSRDWEKLPNYHTPARPEDEAVYKYRMMLKQVDRQFGAFMTKLEDTGVLENSVVILLSDHGDGFDLTQDNLAAAVESPFEISANTRGHATNVFNMGAYRVIAAQRDYRAQGSAPSLVSTNNVSLLDIAPTVLQLAGIELQKTYKMDGVSLLGSKVQEPRFLFMETGFTILEITKAEISEARVMEQSLGSYQVDKAGHLVVRDQWFPFIMNSKHRAVLYGDWQLSLVPSMAEYPVLTNIKTKQWWPLYLYDGDSAPWREMMTAMCQHYENDAGFKTFAKSCNSAVMNDVAIN